MIQARASDIDDVYLTPEEVAGRLRLTVETLANARSRGEGLPWVKIHGRVRYRLADLLEAEAAGSMGFSWARLETALGRYDGLSDTARTKLLKHLRAEMAT
jgi:hypothetical protein